MSKRNPVILIHGIDDTGVLFDRLAAFLESHGWSVHRPDLIPSNGGIGLESLAGQVAQLIKSSFADDEALDLVGFSMGGLVARYYVQRLAQAERVHRLITISSPHRGTWTAFMRWNAGARQMRPQEPLLKRSEPGSQAIEHTSLHVHLESAGSDDHSLDKLAPA